MKHASRLLLLSIALLPILSSGQNYCVPGFNIPGTTVYISNFQLEEINLNVGPGQEETTNFANQGSGTIARLSPGTTYNPVVTSGSFDGGPGLFYYYAIWVDLDQDTTFTADERLATGTTEGAFASGTLTMNIPPDAVRGYTRMRVICTFNNDPLDACGTYSFGESEDYAVLIDDGGPCIPMYTRGTTFSDFIDGVVFSTINNSSSGGVTGKAYTSYVNAGQGFITSVEPGISYSMTITAGTNGLLGVDAEHYSVWVDLDQNGNFSPTENLAGGTTTTPGENLILNVDIPTNARRGYTRMRVMSSYALAPTDPCGTYTHGETEDYTIVIEDGSPCIPVYGAQASQGHYISEVQLADIAWGPVAAPQSGYTDATHIGAHLQSGATSTLTVFGGASPSGYLSAWVDWANNGFDAGDLVGSLPVGTAFAQVSFDVTPPSHVFGYVRLRLAHTDASVGPCDPSDFGSAVDFTLSVDRSGWPCLPLQGYGTQLGDGFPGLTIEGISYAPQTEFPYYSWANFVPYHYEAGSSIALGFAAGDYAPETYRLLLDMNDDGDFSDAGELLGMVTSTVPGQVIFPVCNIPFACPPGQHFMRLRANDDVNYPLVDPCDDQLYGQIFDLVVAVEDPAGPCIPFMSGWTTNGDFIDGVQLGTIQNTGTGSAFGAAYQDYTALTTNLLIGQADTLIITGGANGGDTYSAWIDYNNDNDFDDPGEPLGWIGILDPFGTNELPFTVPPGTTLGNKRMRVRCATIPMSDACLDHEYGETEDYTVNINGSTGLSAAATPDFLVLPTDDGVQLLSDAAYIGYAYTLFDATGRVMSTGRVISDRTDLPMSTFAKGAYTVVLNNDTDRVAKRFVW